MNNPLRGQRKSALSGAIGQVRQDLFAQGQKSRGVFQFTFQSIGQLSERVGHIADYLRMREKNFFDGSREVTDMDHGGTTWAHEKGRVFHCVVANRDAQIGSGYSLVDLVALGDPGFFVVGNGSTRTVATDHLDCAEPTAQTTDKILD